MARTPYRIELKGLESVLHRFENFASTWESEQIKATEKAGDYVLQNLPSYPAKPSTSTYSRTGKLGQTLTRKAERGRGGVVGKIGSNRVYAPWVISETRQSGAGPQTTFHKANGWWTLQNEVKRLRKGIVKVYKAALSRAKG